MSFKKSRKIMATILFFVLASLLNTTFAFADTENIDEVEELRILETKINEQLSEKLNEFTTENGLNVTFENAYVSIADTALDNYDSIIDIENALNEHIQYIQSELLNFRMTVEEKEVQSFISGSGGVWTASVWSGVPGIGWGYIKQDFKATVSNGVIGSPTSLGNSYASGFTFGTWSPNYTTYTRSNSNKYLDIRMKGTYKYGIGDFAINYTATFLEMVKGSGSKLVSR